MVKFPEKLVHTLRKAENVVVMTGAGISSESGVPTFRDARTGLWAQYRPEELATPRAFKEDPRLVWEWYTWRREIISQAEPNPGHTSLVILEKNLPNFTLITQNVDGLHQKAGSQNIIELHGNINRNKCFLENVIIEALPRPDESPPRCPFCGGYVRPDVVWFGESLPAESLRRAWEVSARCEVFFSVGTSALVQPAASLPMTAKDNHAIVVEVNVAATPLTMRADYSFMGPSGELLPRLVELIWP